MYGTSALPLSRGSIQLIPKIPKLAIYRKTPNKGPPPINAPPLPPRPHVKSIFAFLAISQPKMVRFSFCKKLLKGENALFKAIKFANAHGRLLGVLR